MSQARHWCEYCKIFINGSKPSIQFHENGRKHKEIVELFMKDMRKRGRDRQAEEKELNRELEKIERETLSSRATRLPSRWAVRNVRAGACHRRRCVSSGRPVLSPVRAV